MGDRGVGIEVVICWTGVNGVDIEGVVSVDPLRESFCGEMIVMSKRSIRWQSRIPDKHLQHIYTAFIFLRVRVFQ